MCVKWHITKSIDITMTGSIKMVIIILLLNYTMLNRWFSLFVTLDNVCIIFCGETQTCLENQCVKFVSKTFPIFERAYANRHDNNINTLLTMNSKEKMTDFVRKED